MKEFYKTTLSTVAGVVLAALVLGFFGLLYEKSNQYDTLKQRIKIVEAGQQETRDKLGDKIAKLSVDIKKRHGDEDKTPLPKTSWLHTPHSDRSLSPSPSSFPSAPSPSLNNIDVYLQERKSIREVFDK